MGTAYPYILAIHIIFVVCWFAGLFYIVRLFIYHTEAQDKPEPEKTILSKQFEIMERRLWNVITVPSMVLTVAAGITMLCLLPRLAAAALDAYQINLRSTVISLPLYVPGQNKADAFGVVYLVVYALAYLERGGDNITFRDRFPGRTQKCRKLDIWYYRAACFYA